MTFVIQWEGYGLAILGFNNESLVRHGVTQRECIEALADPCVVEVEEGESNSGNPRIMWVGRTQLERLLEVGIEYLDDMDWIYHADNAQSKYRHQYLGA